MDATRTNCSLTHTLRAVNAAIRVLATPLEMVTASLGDSKSKTPMDVVKTSFGGITEIKYANDEMHQ